MSRLFIAFAAGSLLALLISYLAGGRPGLVGMSMGLGSTAFNFGAFRLALWVVGRTVKETKQVDSAGIFGVMALFVKLPIWCVCAIIAQKAGGMVLNGFLIGLGLVYLAAIGWVVAKNC